MPNGNIDRVVAEAGNDDAIRGHAHVSALPPADMDGDPALAFMRKSNDGSSRVLSRFDRTCLLP